LYIFFIILALATSSPAFIYAGSNDVGSSAMDFIQLNHSVKAEAVGNSLTAGTELSAMSLNPASIATLGHIEVQVHNLTYVEGITYTNLSILFPFMGGNAAINAGYMDFGSQARTTVSQPGGVGENFDANAYQVALSWAHSFQNLSLGTSVKYLSQTLDDIDGTAVGLDVGLRYVLSSELAFGLSATNITLDKAKFDKESFDLPQTYRLGFMYKTALSSYPLVLSSDLALPAVGDLYVGAGVSYQIASLLDLRVGYSTYSDLSGFSLGVGLMLDSSSIDFTYKPHRHFGQSYRIGYGLKL